jgi:hypothetical protein
MFFDVLNLLGLAALVAGGWALVGNLQALSVPTQDLRRALVRALAIGVGVGVLCMLARYPYGEVLLDPAGRTRWITGFPFPASGDAGDLVYEMLVADALVGLLVPQLALRLWLARSHAGDAVAWPPHVVSRSGFDYVALVGTLLVAIGYGAFSINAVQTVRLLYDGAVPVVESSIGRVMYLVPLLSALLSCVVAISWPFRKGVTVAGRVVWGAALAVALLSWPLFFLLTIYGSA